MPVEAIAQLPHAFTQANAKEMAKRAIASRMANIAKAKAQAEELAQAKQLCEELKPDARAKEIQELIREQITATRESLNHGTSTVKCTCGLCIEVELSHRDRALLLGALDRLLERERVWSQRAGPGNLKPSSQRQRSGPPTPTV